MDTERDAATAPWNPSGIVTLTTDFGLVDPYVGVMHGVILGRAPRARIVDLTHGVPPQAVDLAGFLLARSVQYFPAGSVHVAVVDPGVGTARRALVAEDRGQAFVAPDNGLLAPVLSRAARVYELDVERFALTARSRTFHGRDVFAPAAAAIAAGTAPRAAGRGAPIEPLARPAPASRPGPDGGEARVVCADRFGNLVLDVEAADLGAEPGRWRLECAGATIPVRGTYAEAEPGALLALVNSFGTLEIAVRDGSAADRLGLARGDRVSLRRIG